MARSLPASLPVPADMRRSAPNWAYHARIDHRLPVQVEPIGSNEEMLSIRGGLKARPGRRSHSHSISAFDGRVGPTQRSSDDVCPASTMPSLGALVPVEGGEEGARFADHLSRTCRPR